MVGIFFRPVACDKIEVVLPLKVK